MTESNPIQESSSSAWIVERNIDSPQFSICVEGEYTNNMPKENDWVVVMEKDGNISEIGHIMRVRIGVDIFTIYFNRQHKIEPPLPISDLELALSREPVISLPFEKFLEILSIIDIIDLEDITIIEDIEYLRDLLDLAVQDDLLGPAGGPYELIKDMSVRERYLVGKLAPRRFKSNEIPNVEPATSTDEANEDYDDEERKPPLHEPGAELTQTSKHTEFEEDVRDETDTGNNQSLMPSSIGLTFCVASNIDTLMVKARWGRYKRVPNNEHDVIKIRRNRETNEEEDFKVRVWKRIPCEGTVSLKMNKGQIKPQILDHAQPDVYLQGTVRTNQENQRLVTLFLVNKQIEPEENKDHAWIFQPEIIVTASDQQKNKDIFRWRTSSDAHIHDFEQIQLELIYRNRMEFAVGHGVSVHVDTVPEDPTRAVCIRSKVIPYHETPHSETPGRAPGDRQAIRKMIDKGWLDMQWLAKQDSNHLHKALLCLVEDYEHWIQEQRKRLETITTTFNAEAGEAIIAQCEKIAQRLHEGINILITDNDALRAFRFANKSMALQRIRGLYALKRRRKENINIKTLDMPENRSWHAFQLGFLLLSLPSLVDPTHSDRTESINGVVDLLWFPTGGGKTEAYLGVAAFAMAIRRLKPHLGNLDGSRGLVVIMRYTLRLLTLQQFQRAATLICAMEACRLGDESTWGKESFSLGLWVGNTITPSTTKQSNYMLNKMKKNKDTRGPNPVQLTSCPWCGSYISSSHNIIVDLTAQRTYIYCSDKSRECIFSHSRSKYGIPVKVVDQEIYRHPPSMMIATVDKFAVMTRRPETKNIFGRATQECERHGLMSADFICTKHQPRGIYPASEVKSIQTIRPPDLIIQDEFHLISGPLGTMVGLYETAIDELCSWQIEDKRIRPKIIASTATVRKAAEQVQSVFMRQVSIFPPLGLDIENNFFSVQRPIVEKPGRRYMGICAPGSSRPAILIRTYTTFLTAAQNLFDHFGSIADPYMTLVGYFNSLRELGGMSRLVEDDVQTRSFRVNMSLIDRPGLSQRRRIKMCELTSRVSSRDIPSYLDALEIPFREEEDGPNPIDVVLASNMLSVGIDVGRLGVMIVNGQPKGTSEYIQATSRVGRVQPGLVATILTWARPRDLSHYETFEHYHATFHQHVEAQSVTPFSSRALDRGLTSTMVAIMRNSYDKFSPNEGANEVRDSKIEEIYQTTQSITTRVRSVTKEDDKEELVEEEIEIRSNNWAQKANSKEKILVYDNYKDEPLHDQLLMAPSTEPWTLWTVLNSMREVEPGVRLIMEKDDMEDKTSPIWQKRFAENEGD